MGVRFVFEEAVGVSCPRCGSEELGVGELTRNHWHARHPAEGWQRRLLPGGEIEEETIVEETYFLCFSCGERFRPVNLGEEQLLEDLLTLGLLSRVKPAPKPALCGTCKHWVWWCRIYREKGFQWECDHYEHRDRRGKCR